MSFDASKPLLVRNLKGTDFPFLQQKKKPLSGFAPSTNKSMEERESFVRWVKAVCIDRVDLSRSWLEGANVVGKILQRNSPI